MKRFLFAGLFAFAATSGSYAGDGFLIAGKLSSVLAAEEACGLSYNQAAIEQFIAENVAADDMAFTGQLDLLMAGRKSSLSEMTPSQKTAHCAQIRRVAKSYKFVD